MTPTDMALELLAETFRKAPVLAEELPETDPQFAELKRKGHLFTVCVDLLRAHANVPSPRLNQLMGLTWTLVSRRIVPVATGLPVATLHVAVVRQDGAEQARIFMPDDWPEMVLADCVGQLGAVVWAGSQAVDFYNGRPGGAVAMGSRAQAFEAEFLLLWQRGDPTWIPNPYQTSVMRRWPGGLDSPGVAALLYDPMPVEVA